MGEKRGRIEREKKEERKRRNSRVRSSHLSLDFSAIGLSNSDEPRGKVDPPLQELRLGTGIVDF